MKIKVNAVVTYPVYINQEIEMPEKFTPEELKEKVLEHADLYLQQGSVSPVITESSTHPELAEWKIQ